MSRIKYARSSFERENFNSENRSHQHDIINYEFSDDVNDESNLDLASESIDVGAAFPDVKDYMHTREVIRSEVAILRQDKRYTRSSTGASQAVDLDPDNLSRTNKMECKHGETLFRYHVRCLSTYKEIYGDMLVKKKYVVSWNKDWPNEMWGLRLGGLVSLIRNKKQYQSHQKELTALGFVFSRQRQDIGWELTKLALETYKTIHDDLLVPYKFKIPDNSNDWPAATWGINLGTSVHNIRHSGTYFAHRDELIELGFQFRASR